MADLRNNYQSRVQTGEMIDQGLRSYMLKVYNLMALGLAITGVAAYLGFNFAVQDNQLTQFGVLLFQSPLRWVVILALFLASQYMAGPRLVVVGIVLWFAALILLLRQLDRRTGRSGPL